ncbi:hypothetical protein GCM10017710_22800 [Arthrobacter ramosus]
MAEGMNVAVHFLRLFERASGYAQQVESDPEKMFADNLQSGFRQEDMDIRNPPGDGVLNRNHGEVRFAGFHYFESIFEAGARYWLHVGEHL